jgi:ABC-type lipoprotein export system ATPase subunit
MPPRRLAEYRTSTLGYADQHYGLMLASELTARELVATPLALRGVSRSDRHKRADELLERVGLSDRQRARPQELSGGEQQRIAVCAALAHRPRLFLADEPTGELDAQNAERLFELIGELVRAERTTTVLVSHDPAAAPVADRVVTIRDGRVAAEAVRRGSTGSDAIVVGRGGWLRLPEEYLRRAGIAARARARLEGTEIVVSAAERAAEPAAAGPQDSRAAAPGSAAVAEVRGVSKGYGRGDAFRPVLTGLDATFHAGRLCAVTGPSGSGKTTLLHLLAGLELPDEGEVVVGGKVISTVDRAGRARLRAGSVAFVGQEPGLTPFLSAAENVELALALHGSGNGGAVGAISAVGLTERAGQRVSRLSTGERGRVALARAIASGAPLLLVDEPTSRLDEANALAVATLLARIARETGSAVLCATHDPILVEQADEELSLA